MILSPGALEGAPGTLVATAEFPLPTRRVSRPPS